MILFRCRHSAPQQNDPYSSVMVLIREKNIQCRAFSLSDGSRLLYLTRTADGDIGGTGPRIWGYLCVAGTMRNLIKGIVIDDHHGGDTLYLYSYTTGTTEGACVWLSHRQFVRRLAEIWSSRDKLSYRASTRNVATICHI